MTTTKTALALLFASLLSIVALAGLFPNVLPLDKENGDHFCSTWSINKDKHFYVTAAHCVVDESDDEEMNSLPIPHLSGGVATVIWTDTKLDLAVIEGPVGNEAFKLAPISPKVGDEVEVVGFPFGMEKTVGHATITNLHQKVEGEGTQKTILVGLGVAPGNSGGPVLKGGKVVSVLQIGWRVGGFYGGIPWDLLVKALKPFTK